MLEKDYQKFSKLKFEPNSSVNVSEFEDNNQFKFIPN